MEWRFRDHPAATAETARVAERLEFDLTPDLGYRYPGAEDPHAERKLPSCARRGWRTAIRGRSEQAEAAARLEEELRVIGCSGLSGSSCSTTSCWSSRARWRWRCAATHRRARCCPGRGRGSSVSSIVCYLTGLSHIDPIRNKLFLGRFLNEEITSLPDIDLDFPRDLREKLIPRVHDRFGRERAALVAAFATYRWRGAIRDLGRRWGCPPATSSEWRAGRRLRRPRGVHARRRRARSASGARAHRAGRR